MQEAAGASLQAEEAGHREVGKNREYMCHIAISILVEEVQKRRECASR